jgi:type I restriction enzyme S subunit
MICNSGNSKNAIMGRTLNSTSLSNLIIPLPPIAEQSRIVKKIEELLPLIERYDESEKRLLELNKKSIYLEFLSCKML